MLYSRVYAELIDYMSQWFEYAIRQSFGIIRVVSLALLFYMPIAAHAQQQMACGEREGIVAQLKEKFGETQAGMGMTRSGSLMEMFTADDGSWTLMLSFPGGRSCLIATGEGWEPVKEAKKPGKDA